MSGRRHGPTKGDRLIGTACDLRVYIGPDEYDQNERIKVADPFVDWSDGTSTDAEWVLNLTASEVRALVRVLMDALDEHP